MTTAFSFTLQIALVDLLVSLPIIYTQALPNRQRLSLLLALSLPAAIAPQPRGAAGAAQLSQST